MKPFHFTLEFQVRDYECDFQGIVNHAVYFHYLEHARHEFAKQCGLQVVNLAQRGINLVLIRAEVDYKRSLHSGERFVVGVDVQRTSRLRWTFEQEIYQLPNEQLIVCAKIITTAVNEHGKPFLPKELENFPHQP